MTGSMLHTVLPGRAGIRRLARWTTIAACVPYLVLKASWIAGGTAGWPAAAEQAPAYANAITLVLDLLVVVLAVALTSGWACRVPAWLVTLPIWVGSGLLAPIAVGIPLTLFAVAFSSPGPSGGADGLQSWVYALVYGGFIIQALGLAVAFVLHARERWPDVFRLRTRDVPLGVTHRTQKLICHVSALLGIVYASLLLAWSLGFHVGLLEQTPLPAPTQRVFNAVLAGATVAGVAGLLVLMHRGRGGGKGRFLMPLTAAWVGAASTFGWALYPLLVALARPAGPYPGIDAGGSLVLLAGTVSGLLMGVVGAFLLTELGISHTVSQRVSIRPGGKPS